MSVGLARALTETGARRETTPSRSRKNVCYADEEMVERALGQQCIDHHGAARGPRPDE